MKSMQQFKLFVTGHKGFETLLFHELRMLLGDSGAVLEKRYGGVEIAGDLDAIYRLCLHSRLANRVFCELAKVRVEDDDQLYQAVSKIDWTQHLQANGSLAVSATLSRSKLTHSHFTALRVKDAIVDQFRARSGDRPSVEKNQPDIQIHVNIHQDQASISLDLSGDSLHRRGYRLQHTGAPLKEHLAAALLMQAGWNKFTGFENTVAWFGNPDWGLGLPWPELMVTLAAGTELIGGVHYVAGGDTITYELCFEDRSAAAVGNVFYFEFDSSTLTSDARQALDAHINLLRGSDRSVRLEGHTDERGTREYNMALGERRANAVRDYMAGSGIANYRVETVSYGEEQPVGYGSGESNWAQNRRVELK